MLCLFLDKTLHLTLSGAFEKLRLFSLTGKKRRKDENLTMNQTAPIKSAIDPVCGMSVDPRTTEIVATIEGEHYYFCAEGCRKAFVENPKKFLKPECDKPKGLWGRYMARLQKATGGKSMKCH